MQPTTVTDQSHWQPSSSRVIAGPMRVSYSRPCRTKQKSPRLRPCWEGQTILPPRPTSSDREICCCERPSAASLCPHARFEPPPRPGLPDADLLAGMVPESMAALREREWRSGASLIPRWYKLLLVGVGTMGAAWGVTGSPQQALAVACAGSCLALVASESYRRLRQLKLTPMNPRAPA